VLQSVRSGSLKLLSSVVKTLRVLEAFSPERQELSTVELSRLLEMDKSSVSRIVVTLQHNGYLSRNALTGKYRLGAPFIDLGNQVLDRYDRMDIGEIALPFLRRLAHSIEEVAHLAILDNQDVVTLKKMDGGQIVTVDTKVGGRYPAHSCALGKVLLAGLTGEKLGELLGSRPLVRRTPATIVEMPALTAEIDAVREQGYAFENEESFLGICCVAAPVRDHNGSVLAAVSATLPKQRSERKRMEEIRLRVMETAAQISKQIYGDL
jgi:IclR family KDG regulon transcriptional repressor